MTVTPAEPAAPQIRSIFGPPHTWRSTHLNLQLALRLAVQPGVEVPDEDHGVAVDSSI